MRAKDVAASTHGAASDREKNKHDGQREQQQYDRGCDDENLASWLPPSEYAESQPCKRGDKYDPDNESEKWNTKQPKSIVVGGDHGVELVVGLGRTCLV